MRSFSISTFSLIIGASLIMMALGPAVLSAGSVGIQFDVSKPSYAPYVGTESPGHSLGEFLPSHTSWNAVTGDTSSGLLYADGSAATGVEIDFGRSSGGTTIDWGLAGAPWSYDGSTILPIYDTDLMRDWMYSSGNNNLAARVRGLPAGSYSVVALVREPNELDRTYNVNLGVNLNDTGDTTPLAITDATGVTTWTPGKNFARAVVTSSGPSDWITAIVDPTNAGYSTLEGLQIAPVLHEGFESDSGHWTVSGGMNSTRPMTHHVYEGNLSLSSWDRADEDPPGVVRNVYSGYAERDDLTSIAWGPIFQVEDGSGSITFQLNGGSHALDLNSMTAGGTGVALFDLDAGEFLPGTFRTHSEGSFDYEGHSIPLAGLEGKTVMLAVIDRQQGSYGFVGVDSIVAPLSGVEVAAPDMHHKIRLDYGFDSQGDFMGWYQEGEPGDPTSFQIGRTQDDFTNAKGHINLNVTPSHPHTPGEGFVSSALTSDWDGPTGVLRSPEFTLDGEILEFYVGGGPNPDVAFELLVDMEDGNGFVSQRTSRNEVNGDFTYDFWTIKDLAGYPAYLRLTDNATDSWGWIAVDGIRMVAFNVPEPSTFGLGLLGLLGLAGYGRRRRK
jgi:MYXO-CTERM domain-containing protein